MLSPDVGAVRHGSAAVADHTVLFFKPKILFSVFFILFSLSIINYILLILLLIIVFQK